MPTCYYVIRSQHILQRDLLLTRHSLKSLRRVNSRVVGLVDREALRGQSAGATSMLERRVWRGRERSVYSLDNLFRWPCLHGYDQDQRLCPFNFLALLCVAV